MACLQHTINYKGIYYFADMCGMYSVTVNFYFAAICPILLYRMQKCYRLG